MTNLIQLSSQAFEFLGLQNYIVKILHILTLVCQLHTILKL
jgi:hypothetical protein